MGPQSTYAYRARDRSGEIVEGTMAAATAAEVGARLRSEGKYVIRVGSHAHSKVAADDEVAVLRGESAKRVRRDEVIAFAQQMGVMLETGVPLGEALESFRKQQTNPSFAVVLSGIADDIQSGEPISAAFARWPRVFPPIMVSLMKASEASGTMSSMLGRVAEYMSKERRTVKQIKGALSYPVFMMTLGLGITIFLMAFVLPRFAKIYEQRAASLPAPTRVLMGVSDFVIGSYMIYGPVIAAATVFVFFMSKRPAGRCVFDWLRLNVPVVKRLYRQLYLTRASRTMATLLEAGVGLLDIIAICRDVTRNYFWDRLWDDTDAAVRNGKQISEAFAESAVVPPNVASMVAAGERAGQLSRVMYRIAEFADEELDHAVKQTTAFIEPVMICTMGIVVGGVALALLMPIFSIGSVMAGT